MTFPRNQILFYLTKKVRNDFTQQQHRTASKKNQERRPDFQPPRSIKVLERNKFLVLTRGCGSRM